MQVSGGLKYMHADHLEGRRISLLLFQPGSTRTSARSRGTGRALREVLAGTGHFGSVEWLL